MKRALVFLLTLAMLAILCIPAFANDAATFDPSVTIETKSNQITVKVNAIPEGVAAPTLTVACPFTQAEVTGPDNNKLENVTLDATNKTITFPVAKGGTYIIKNTAPAPTTGGGGGVPQFGISVTPSEGGTVKPSKTSAPRDTKITLTVTPDEGYKLDKLTVTNSSGEAVPVTDNGDGVWTFTLPAMKVTVTATFVKDESQPTPPPADSAKFVDVPEDAWYHDAVYWAAEQGITQGTDETHFSPDASCTRGQMVTFLWRAAGQPVPANNANPFTDVTGDDYFYPAVMWAVEKGITQGVDATHFSPNAIVNRAQGVTFLYRFTGEKTDGTCLFTDVSPDDYFYDAVVWAAANNVTAGKTATTFAPGSPCTRGQIVTFLFRASGQGAQ